MAQGISCAANHLIQWPHLQVNTLVKVSDDTHSPADFDGVVCKTAGNTETESELIVEAAGAGEKQGVSSDKLRNMRG